VDRRADDFVRRASHELRTPLTSIVGYVDVLLDDAAGFSEEQVKHLQAIKRNATRLEQTITDVMAAAANGVGAGAVSWLEAQRPDSDE
jgi:two-component system phosphate regulon sensor histidine kinase PhoR